MRDKILEDLKTAMKMQDKERLMVIRMVKGAIQMEELNKKANLDDNEVINVIQKQIKSRKDAIVEFEKAGREDLIKQNEREIEVLMEYMPEQLSEDEIRSKVKEVIETVKPESSKDMGKVMKELSCLKGKADMSLVSSIVKELMN